MQHFYMITWHRLKSAIQRNKFLICVTFLLGGLINFSTKDDISVAGVITTSSLESRVRGLSTREDDFSKIILSDVKMQDSPVSHVWKNAVGCSNFDIRLAEQGELPLMALTSYPGSGNTWTRRLIELSSGVFTGSIYQDNTLYYSGFLGEKADPYSGMTLVQKDHGFDSKTKEMFNRKAIVIIRNPYRAIISYHNYLYGGHTGLAPSSKYLKKSWTAFIMEQLLHWSRHIQAWVSTENQVLVVHYELLRQHPAEQVRRILQFIGWPTNVKRLKCVKGDLSSNDMKRHRQYRPRQLVIFSDKIRHYIDMLINDVNHHLQLHQHPALPLHLYEFFNNTRVRSEILEDCRSNETLSQCAVRVDRLNMPTHLKSMLEYGRVSVRSTLDDLSSPLINALTSVWRSAHRHTDTLK